MVDSKNKALHITSVYTGQGRLMMGPNANFKNQPSDYVQDALPPGNKTNISQNEENVNPENLSGNLREGSYTPTAEEIAKAKREYDEVAAQYKGTDAWLKAPNGKPTNLAERQWVQVRTPSFKAWFGDWENDPANASKVVDENGEPLVVYHGSPSEFDIFSSLKMGTHGTSKGKGYYFTPTKSMAEGYEEKGGKLYEAFLNIRKPLAYDGREMTRKDVAKLIDTLDRNLEKANGEDMGILMDFGDVNREGRAKVLNEAVNLVNGNESDVDIFSELVNMSGQYDAVASTLRDTLGYDGIIPTDTDNEIVALNPNQIKFADNNVGTFDNRSLAGNLRESEPNGIQKSANVNYPNASKDVNMMFAGLLREGMGNKRKAEAERLITKKRPDLADDAKRLVDEIAKFELPKEQKAALHWVIAGSIRLPEDAYKVTEAIGYGERAKGKGETDAMKYKSPMEMIEALHQFKPKAKPIDPDTVPELSDKKDLGYGVTTYLVQDDREGQLAMRKIINTHWGEDANPWCLLCGDGKGNLADGSNNTYNAWHYWQYYDALPKRVAFQNGKLLAFMATEGEEFSEEDPMDFIDNYTDEVYEEDISEEVVSLIRTEKPELWDEFIEIAEDDGYDEDESGFREWMFDVNEGIYNEFEDKILDEKLSEVRNQLESEHEDWLKRKKEAEGKETWWDREDRAYEGIPISTPLEKDPLKRSINVELYSNGHIDSFWATHRDFNGGYGLIHKDEKDRITRRWNSDGTLKELTDFEDDGSYTREEYNHEGFIINRYHYNAQGVKDGPYETYLPGSNGNEEFNIAGWKSILEKRGSYKNGKLDGVFEYWHPNGQIKQRGFAQNGKFVGEGREWFDDGSLAAVAKFDNDGKSADIKKYKKGEFFEETPNSTGGNAGLLREDRDSYDGVLYLSHVYRNGKRVKMSDLKHGDRFSHEEGGEQFVFVDGFNAVNKAVYELSALAVRNKREQPKEGYVMANGNIYRFKITDFGLRVKGVLPISLKNVRMFNEWKENNVKSQNDKTSGINTASDARVTSGPGDGGLYNGITPVGKTASQLDGVDRTLQEDLWENAKLEYVPDSSGDYPQTPSNAKGTNVGGNAGFTRAATPLSEHLQARRDAMPKRGD